ncbi:hypothetical protein G7054_g7156 [Neopestalotiopsis clavispora]|nr:hypothetical protein G7054_g7156 [Neopestalotiopsis clavispora]
MGTLLANTYDNIDPRQQMPPPPNAPGIAKQVLFQWLLDADIPISAVEKDIKVTRGKFANEVEDIGSTDMRQNIDSIFKKSEEFNMWTNQKTSDFLVLRDTNWKNFNKLRERREAEPRELIPKELSLAGLFCAQEARSFTRKDPETSDKHSIHLSYFCGSQDIQTRFPGDEGIMRFLILQLLVESGQTSYGLDPSACSGLAAPRNLTSLRNLFWGLCKAVGYKLVMVIIHDLEKFPSPAQGGMGTALDALVDVMRPLVENQRIPEQSRAKKNEVEFKLLVSNWNEQQKRGVRQRCNFLKEVDLCPWTRTDVWNH